jgi:ArsR family transcriptional regulator
MQNKFLLLSERSRREIISSLPRDNQILKLADYFQNFSDSTRIKILTCLSMSSMCVNDISTLLGINQTTISHQLKLLKDQGLVSYKREGKILIYSLQGSGVNDMMMYAISAI